AGIVQFDYDAEAPDELTLRVGDVINNVKNVEEGWCQGSLGDKVGMFPDNFVKVSCGQFLVSSKKQSIKVSLFCCSSVHIVVHYKIKVLRKVKATFEYEPVNADELRLAIGDIVEVYRDVSTREEEGWAFGGLNGKEGCFPTNFTTV
uniref:SH3 domain-containing protein n=1 Tax=Ciona savignyi TaxID=51511 RepID=H2YDA9_CIOSA